MCDSVPTADNQSVFTGRRRNSRKTASIIKEAGSMNKDRIEGAAKQAVGAVKETAGKILGDAKLQSDGKTLKVEGTVQNAVGGVVDALKK
jgi:uncharacterized protein YjbJ (UPF0337 family)